MEPIKITEKAQKYLKEALATKKIPEGFMLRMGAKGGGCHGVNTYLGFDKETEEDKRYTISGIELIIKKKEVMFLIGKKLDYVDEGEVQGFVFLTASAEEK
ncbi:iron-sulfur cluster assembly accessory protein [Persicobacter psychrovividus]|uniref:Core domain-containing protein n=1 Tax=Persicobacter psychrovividus TaxID=387638 RepID=A0ABN6L5T9_9BACT|nr:hypothetical protein PEPS_06210 [Persicobacter psychrovividus]